MPSAWSISVNRGELDVCAVFNKKISLFVNIRYSITGKR